MPLRLQPAQSRRSAPHADRRLWLLLPVFVAFLALIVLAAAGDERLMQSINTLEFEALPPVMPEPVVPAIDVSVPSAEAAMARLPDAVAEPIATF